MSGDESDDDWETQELPPLPAPKKENEELQEQKQQVPDDDGEYWDDQQKLSALKADEPDLGKSIPSDSVSGVGEPMFLVDLTELSHGQVHSKFDLNSVNDPVAVKQWRSKLERSYDSYKSDASMLANRTVIPCGTSVWRPALSTLRKEKPGHYFCPIFPPKKK